MTTRKTTPATATDAAEKVVQDPAKEKVTAKPRTPRKPAAKDATAKTATARKAPAKVPAAEAKKPRARKPATDWANLYEHEPTPAETVTPVPTTPPATVDAPAPARPQTPVIEMTVTPVRKLARPKRHQLSFRMPTDIPDLLTEAQQITYDRGEAMSRDLIVAAAIRQWVERERAALARAKSKETDG